MNKNKYMNFRYLPLAVFIALMPVGPSKFLNQMSGIQHNRAKDPNWPEANQLAIYTFTFLNLIFLSLTEWLKQVPDTW